MSDIAFPSGLPGFEQCRRFVLLEALESSPVRCLRSVDGPTASFLVIDPRAVEPRYETTLADADRRRLAANTETPLLWLALLTSEADGTISANLRAPIVINADTMTGAQVIPKDSRYALRHVVAARG